MRPSPHERRFRGAHALWQSRPQESECDLGWPVFLCAGHSGRQGADTPCDHDADDHGWQFIGSSDASVVDGRVVCLEEIVQLDPSVLAVADLPPGWQAVRKRLGAR